MSPPSLLSFLIKAFDIDGVLVRGRDVLPGARDSLRALEDAGVPFVFVTNGGGEPEDRKHVDFCRGK